MTCSGLHAISVTAGGAKVSSAPEIVYGPL
jgi:hypothetical protein